MCISSFRLYKDFSSGIFDQWLSHGCDMVHLWTDEAYPTSVMATGGNFTWKDGRENPDICVAAVTYPKGFLYTYKTMFSNSYRSFSRIQGRDGTIENYGGEGCVLVYRHHGGRPQGIRPDRNRAGIPQGSDRRPVPRRRGSGAGEGCARA